MKQTTNETMNTNGTKTTRTHHNGNLAAVRRAILRSDLTQKSIVTPLVCECAHEWSVGAAAESADEKRIVKDASGNVLNDGDTITVIKNLKVKGLSLVMKVGTKVKNIRLVEGDMTSTAKSMVSVRCL